MVSLIDVGQRALDWLALGLGCALFIWLAYVSLRGPNDLSGRADARRDRFIPGSWTPRDLNHDEDVL